MIALDEAQVAALHRLRDEIVAAGETNSEGGPSCGVLSEGAGPLVGGTEFYGAYLCDDGTAPEHAWVVLPDGTIVDASADQFGGPPIVVIPPGDSRAARYLDQEGDDCR